MVKFTKVFMSISKVKTFLAHATENGQIEEFTSLFAQQNAKFVTWYQELVLP